MSYNPNKGKIVSGGHGGFLCPPTHPAHTLRIETDLRRWPENRSSMGLEYAAECEWLDAGTKASAKRILANWRAPDINSATIRAWISSVLGYFRSCYRNPEAGERQWNAGDLIIDKDRDPMENPSDHAGVNLIRKYYPDYAPSRADFATAQWGKAS